MYVLSSAWFRQCRGTLLATVFLMTHAVKTRVLGLTVQIFAHLKRSTSGERWPLQLTAKKRNLRPSLTDSVRNAGQEPRCCYINFGQRPQSRSLPGSSSDNKKVTMTTPPMSQPAAAHAFIITRSRKRRSCVVTPLLDRAAQLNWFGPRQQHNCTLIGMTMTYKKILRKYALCSPCLLSVYEVPKVEEHKQASKRHKLWHQQLQAIAVDK